MVETIINYYYNFIIFECFIIFLTGNLWSLFYWKWKQAMLDIIFCFIVMCGCSLNYISAAINMFKWKRKEWCLICFVCKYSEEDCSSRGELTDVIKYAAVCRITRLASFRPRELTLPSLTCEVRITEDASLKFVYLVLRNTRRPNVKSPDYLPNLLGT